MSEEVEAAPPCESDDKLHEFVAGGIGQPTCFSCGKTAVQVAETLVPAWWKRDWCWVSILDDMMGAADNPDALKELANNLFAQYGPCCDEGPCQERTDG